MGWQHGKSTKISVDGDDLSAYSNTSEFEEGSDEHDVTTYGKNAHVVQGGLLTGKFTMGGVYENTAAVTPKALLPPLIGTVVEVIRQPEGLGTGKPTQTFDALLTKYVETAPVADMVTWSAEFTRSDETARTSQA
jgi:hypothetical protein